MSLKELAYNILDNFNRSRVEPYRYRFTDLSRCPRAILIEVFSLADPQKDYRQLGGNVLDTAIHDLIKREAVSRLQDFVVADKNLIYNELINLDGKHHGKPQIVTVAGRVDLVFMDKVVSIKTVNSFDDLPNPGDLIQVSYHAAKLDTEAEIWYISRNEGKYLTYELNFEEIQANWVQAKHNLANLAEHESRHELPVIPVEYSEDKYPCSYCSYKYFCYPKEEEEE